MIRVVLADDQALVRAGFRTLLDAQEDVDVVGEASDGHEAIALASRLVPALILMDIRMPGLDGWRRPARSPARTRGPHAGRCGPLERRDRRAARRQPLHVQTQVSRAMTKLDARDRAQLVVYAYESGLVRPG